MPALDKIHDAVRRALEKDGWTITFDPFQIRYLDVLVFADLKAERSLGARRGDRKIVVESKSFIGVSDLQDFKLALGQYFLYQAFLEKVAPNDELFLAISLRAFDEFFQKEAIQYVVERYGMALLVVDVDEEEIVQWRK